MKRSGILRQTIIIFAVSVLLISIVSTAALYFYAVYSIRDEQVRDAEAIAGDVEGYIMQFPAHDWLLQYWYENHQSLDIEYDAAFTEDTETAAKCRLLMSSHPDFQLEYASVGDVEALPAEDQKLYAEIVYSWIITYFDKIAEEFDINYLFCFETSAPYDKEFIYFISDNEGKERGDGPDLLYPYGKVLDLTTDAQKTVNMAVLGTPSLSLNEDGKYVDLYYHIGSFGDHEVLLGLARYYPKYLKTVRSAIVVYVIMFLGFLTAFAAVCIFRLRSRILEPVKKIQRTIRQYKDTKDSEAAAKLLSEVATDNELADLSDDIVSLAREMDDYTSKIRSITAESERIETELSLASRIQLALMPTDFGSVKENVEIYAATKPAKVVGGDFYDFFMIDDDRLCVMIADVSGKGIPAALFVMASKISLTHTVKEGKTPAEILTAVNQAITEHNPEDMFVTVWLGILDLKTGVLTASNAGHDYPVIRHPGGDYELLKDKHGFVLGTIPDIRYKEYEVQLEPGSSLFIYTDGIPEATDSDHKMFGTDRMLAELNRTPDASPEEIIGNISNAVDKFVGGAEQFDDLTMLCLHYKG